MSQTSRQGGNDPERDEWLKQFSGLPESSTEDETFNDRIVVERMEQRRADPMTIEGEINAIGEMAREVKARASSQHSPESESDNGRPQWSSRLITTIGLVLTTIAILGMALAMVSY